MSRIILANGARCPAPELADGFSGSDRHVVHASLDLLLDGGESSAAHFYILVEAYEIADMTDEELAAEGPRDDAPDAEPTQPALPILEDQEENVLR